MAVSGGSDSVALAFLAKNTFKRVLGITVDHQYAYSYLFSCWVCVCVCVTNNPCCVSHRVRAESAEEAEKAKEIVKGMGKEQMYMRITAIAQCHVTSIK